MKVFSGVFIFLLIQMNVLAQSYQNAYFDALFSLDFEKSDSILKVADAFLSTEERLLTVAFTALLRYDAGGHHSKSERDLCMANAKAGVALLKKKSMSDSQLFYYMSGLGMIIKLKMDEERYVSVVSDLYGLISKIDYVLEHENDRPYFRLISGFYHYYAALAAEDYPAMRAVLFLLPEGNKAHGLKLLKSCTSEPSVMISVYAYYTLARIYHRDEKVFFQSDFYFNELLERYPENCAWRREYIMMLNSFNEAVLSQKQNEILKSYGCNN